MKKAIFTVLLGGYDNEPRPFNQKGWDNILFTDKMPKQTKGWDKVYLKPTTDNPALESRRYKWLSHIHLHEYDLVCYHDANIVFKRSITEHPFRITHNKRKTVLEEAIALNEQQNRCTVESVNAQIEAFNKAKFPDNIGLFYNGYFVREHNEKENKLCELVWEIINQYTPRDQLALPFAMWKLNYKQENIKDIVFFKTSSQRLIHKITKPKLHGKIQPRRVHHITPGASDKNWGKAINEIIEKLPDNDWICLRDIDTLPMYHEKFFEQCEEIALNTDYILISCMTNRLGLKEQLVPNMYEETDIKVHRSKAIELYNEKATKIKKVKGSLAVGYVGGIMMLFPKSIWQKVGGFRDGDIIQGNIFIDYDFCSKVSKFGKIGIAEGIYLFHWYRFDKDRKDKSHLK